MIIFEAEGNKKIILIVLVVFFMGVITWQWVKQGPFSSIEKKDTLLTEIKAETDNSFKGIKNSINEGKESIKLISEEANKQIKQEQLIEEARKYLEDKKVDLSLLVPDNKISCEEQDGQWKVIDGSCILATTDAGAECNNKSQCQGECIASLPEGYDETKLIEINGVCSDSVPLVGCFAIVEDGLVNGITCLD